MKTSAGSKWGTSDQKTVAIPSQVEMGSVNSASVEKDCPNLKTFKFDC